MSAAINSVPVTRRPAFPIRCWRATRPTIAYWFQTEVHVYAFSIAANVLLSFYPMLILLLSVCKKALHWQAGADAVTFALNDYFPASFIQWMAEDKYTKSITSHGRLQLASVLLLLFTSNGIFMPMEIALNRVWGCRENRSFIRNQIVSYVLIFACGALLMLSATLTALNNQFVAGVNVPALAFASVFALHVAAVPITVLILFLIYWILPNRRVQARDVLPAAIIVGLILEGLKYLNLVLQPWTLRRLTAEYGYHFRYAVAVLFWGFVASMLILGGAEWTARHRNAAVIDSEKSPPAGDNHVRF